MNVILLPGINNSGPRHWQSVWESCLLGAKRFKPHSWDKPRLKDWELALSTAVQHANDQTILVAHSLSCLLVAHWSQSADTRRIAGALLVAVPDPDAPNFPREAATFKNPPNSPLPFPTLVIASTDDPFSTVAHSTRRATAWNAGLVVAGALGHMNEASNMGYWPEGRALLAAFRTGLGMSEPHRLPASWAETLVI